MGKAKPAVELERCWRCGRRQRAELMVPGRVARGSVLCKRCARELARTK